MGWLFSIVLFIFACVHSNDVFMITSGLFAIAGAIGFLSNDIGNTIRSIFKVDSDSKGE